MKDASDSMSNSIQKGSMMDFVRYAERDELNYVIFLSSVSLIITSLLCEVFHPSETIHQDACRAWRESL